MIPAAVFPNALRSPTQSGRPYPPEIVAVVRALIEHAGLSQREAAARAGLRQDTVGRWARRFGWRRANVGGVGARAGLAQARQCERSEATKERLPYARGVWVASSASPPRNDGGPRRTGKIALAAPAPSEPRRPYRYDPAVRDAARVRVEGTRDAMARIARELGVDRATLYCWAGRFGWRRPPASAKAAPDFYRSRRLGRPYGGDAVSAARDLVTGSVLPLRQIAARAGVSQSTVSGWSVRHGWTRPAAVATGRRLDRPPYGPAVVAAARELYETTTLSTRMIAARAKATRERVARWARTGGWTRPR